MQHKKKCVRTTKYCHRNNINFARYNSTRHSAAAAAAHSRKNKKCPLLKNMRVVCRSKQNPSHTHTTKLFSDLTWNWYFSTIKCHICIYRILKSDIIALTQITLYFLFRFYICTRVVYIKVYLIRKYFK